MKTEIGKWGVILEGEESLSEVQLGEVLDVMSELDFVSLVGNFLTERGLLQKVDIDVRELS